MNKLTLFLFLIVSPLIQAKLSAQEDDSGIDFTQCDFETDAPAVVIFDKGETEFYQDQDGFYINFQRHKRVKIFKESAFDEAEVSIELYIGNSDLEKVYDIEATTYNKKGDKIEVTHLDPKQIFREPINDYWYRKKFALPNIKEGCVIEYKYSIKSPFFSHLPDWEFQSDIPTIYSEYVVSMTPFYSYMYRAQGFGKFDVFENKKLNNDRSFIGMSFRDVQYKFGMKNLSSFKDESYISSKEDYIKKIDFQLSKINYPNGYSKKYMTTWPELSKSLLESSSFGKYIDKCEKIGDKQFEHLHSKSDLEKINAVLDYMKSNYKPDGYTNKWTSKTIKEFNKEKTGNTANINLMTLGILRGVGIEAEPIIISTRNHGKVSDRFPFSDLFNNVIIMATVDGKKKLFDATDSYCPNNMLPAMCYNGRGYMVKKDSESWVQIKNNNLSTISTTIKYSLDPESNTLSGFGVVRNSGHQSIKERKRYKRDPEKFKQAILDKGLSIKKEISVSDMDEEAKIFQYNFDFESKVDNIEGQIIFAPFFKFPDQTNPFKQEKRELAIDLIYPTAESYTAEIEIPEGYKIEQLPEPFAKNSENTQMVFKAQQSSNNKILISATISLKKPVYSASVYPELKRLFNNAIEKLNQKIVIVKEDAVAMQ